MNLRLACLPALLALAACSSSPSGDLAGEQAALSPATAPWAVVDLASGQISWLVDPPDVAGTAGFRDGMMVFRRVGSGASQCLVGVCEVTQAQWRRLAHVAAGAEPWASVPLTLVPAEGRSDARPAFNLSYADILPVLASVHLADGGRLALPTAAQWETAAGGSSGWAWGGAASPERLRATSLVRDTCDGQAGPRPVGRGAATGNGFYDLHGNVREWVAPGDAVRGGSWADDANDCRIEQAAGPGLSPGLAHALVGARLVLRP